MKFLLAIAIALSATAAQARIQCNSSSGRADISFMQNNKQVIITSYGQFPSNRLYYNSVWNERAWYRSGIANVAIINKSIFETGRGRITYKYEDIYADHPGTTKTINFDCN